MSVVEIEGLSFTYQGARQSGLRDIDLTVQEGEFVLVTGKSACGKTTLTRLVNGLIPHFFPGELSGRVSVGGRDTAQLASYDLAETVGSVFQDPRSQFFATSAVAEVAFGCENLRLPAAEIRRRVERAFADFGIEDLIGRSVFDLSSGEKQKVALASAYAMEPSVFVLDEPSANLDVPSTRMLAGLLKTLKEQGRSVIVSEHRLYYLMDLVDRVVFMEDGRIAGEWTAREALALSQDKLANLGLRAFDLARVQLPGRRKDGKASGGGFAAGGAAGCGGFAAGCDAAGSGATGALPSLRVRDVSFSRGGREILKATSFEAGRSKVAPQEGEARPQAGPAAHEGLRGADPLRREAAVVGVTGPNGAGKTTLMKCLCGLARRCRGGVELDGAKLSARGRARAMYCVMQDADYQLFTESVEDELRLGNKGGMELEARMSRALESLGLASCRDVHPMALSGGQKQRVTIAAASASPSRVLFFDEPTSGLDADSMRKVGSVVSGLSAQGRLVFVISHDLEFLASTCDRIMYVQDGAVVEDFPLDADTLPRLTALLFRNGPLQEKLSASYTSV